MNGTLVPAIVCIQKLFAKVMISQMGGLSLGPGGLRPGGGEVSVTDTPHTVTSGW